LPGGIEAFAGVGSSVRLPDPQERYYAVRRAGTDWVGNPSLPLSRNNEVDLGINIRSRWFTLRPTVFYSRLRDLVVVTQRERLAAATAYPNALARSYEAVDARMYGGEVSFSVGLARALLLSGGTSYVRGIHFAQQAAGLPKSDLAETPPLKARASLRYGRRLFFSEINAAASAPQNRVDMLLLETRTPGYALLGCDVGMHHSRFSMSVGVDNLLNRYYREHLSFQRDPFRSGVRIPEPGRSVHVNVTANLRDR
jgi:iron complex outermembrane receptor protein